MSSVSRLCLFLLLGASSGVVVSANAQAADAGTLEQQLKAALPPTRFSSDRGTIVRPGTILELEKDGLLAYTVMVQQPPRNTLKNGRFGQSFADTLAVNVPDGAGYPGGATAIPQRKLVAGEKFWLSDISVGRDTITLRVVTDPYADGRYWADIKFPFAKNTLPTPDDALRTFRQVLTPEGPASQDQPPPLQTMNTPNAAAPSMPLAPSFPADASNPPAPSVVGGPPPAALPNGGAASPVPASAGMNSDAAVGAPNVTPETTIAPGQAKNDVIAAMGQPQRAVKFGKKEILYYPGLKVTLIDGKVSAVE